MRGCGGRVHWVHGIVCMLLGAGVGEGTVRCGVYGNVDLSLISLMVWI